MKLSNKELRKVADEAVKRGWELSSTGSSHGALTNRHHRITVASSPSDQNAHKNMLRRIRKCEDGTCMHGSPAAVVKQKLRTEHGTAAAAVSPGPAALKALSKQLLTTTGPIVTPTRSEIVKRTETRREATARWAKWYVSSHPGIADGKAIRKDAEAAGHTWATTMEELRKLSGVTMARRGRGGTIWSFPGENTAQAHTPADPALSVGKPRTAAASGGATSHVPTDRPHAAVIGQEWCRLEGMAEGLGLVTVLDQIHKLQALIGEGS